MASSTVHSARFAWLGVGAVTAALALLLVAGQRGQAQTVETERAALARAKAQAAEATRRAAAFEAQAAAERSRERKAQVEAAAVATRIQAAEADMAAARARVRLIQRAQAELAADLAEKQRPAVRLVAALQTLSRRPPLLAIAQPGSLTDMVHTRAALSGILPEIQRRTAGLRADLAQSRQLRRDADRAVAALDAGRQRLAAERAALVQVAARHRQAAVGIAGSALAEQDRAVAMGERARDIVDLIGQLNVDTAVRARLETLPGPLLRPGDPQIRRALPIERASPARDRLPYRLPVAGTLVTGLGEVSATGIRARGLTIATAPEAQVVAPAAGRIVFAGPFRSFGDVVIIDHGAGWTTMIANLAARDVRVGDRVIQGGPIGRAARDRSQVLIELRRNMRPIDIGWLLG